MKQNDVSGEKGRETRGDYWDLLSKSPQQRCPGCMKLFGAVRGAET